MDQSSLTCQTPYFCKEREKESGNTAYNEFYQAKRMWRDQWDRLVDTYLSYVINRTTQKYKG